MSRRGITLLLGTGAAVGGYYLYSAGGDPKVAQKNAEGTYLYTSFFRDHGRARD